MGGLDASVDQCRLVGEYYESSYSHSQFESRRFKVKFYTQLDGIVVTSSSRSSFTSNKGTIPILGKGFHHKTTITSIFCIYLAATEFDINAVNQFPFPSFPYQSSYFRRLNLFFKKLSVFGPNILA